MNGKSRVEGLVKNGKTIGNVNAEKNERQKVAKSYKLYKELET